MSASAVRPVLDGVGAPEPGKEAFELRSAIEKAMTHKEFLNAPRALIQDALDSVNARDSLAYLEEREEAKKRIAAAEAKVTASREPIPITEWGVSYNPYAAPEVVMAFLFGKLSDGRKVSTSNIVDVLDDFTVRTSSGSIYRLTGGYSKTEENLSRFKLKPLEHVERCLRIQANIRNKRGGGA